MKVTLTYSTIIAALFVLTVCGQGCAKESKFDSKARSTASAPRISPVTQGPATASAPDSAQTAILVSNVAFYYSHKAVREADNFNAMLGDDGGCQMASDFQNAIGPNNFMQSVASYCAYQRVDCTRVNENATRITTYLAKLAQLCQEGGPGNPYQYGDETTARNLLSAGELYRTDLGLTNPQ